jgi:hypothetical protein
MEIYPLERKTPSFRGDISDLAGSLLLVNVLFEDADWSSSTRSCEVGGRPQSALPIPLPQIGPFLSEHFGWRLPTHIEKWFSRDTRPVSTTLPTSGGKISTPLGLGRVRRGRAMGY